MKRKCEFLKRKMRVFETQMRVFETQMRVFETQFFFQKSILVTFYRAFRVQSFFNLTGDYRL